MKMSKIKDNVIKDTEKKIRKKLKDVHVKSKNLANPKPDINKKRAKHYLKRWYKDRNNWKFEKVQQIWLIKHMFNPFQVPEKTFQIFVDYISASKGQVLQRITDICEEVIQTMIQRTELKESGLSEEEIISKYPLLQQIEDEKHLRARRILQSLKDDTVIKK